MKPVIKFGMPYFTGAAVMSLVVPVNQLSIDIPNLVTYTPYAIEVSAMTKKGSGAKQIIYVWTIESSK